MSKQAKRRKETCTDFIENHSGITMVEVICTIAIMAILFAAIGTILLYATRTYQKGSTQTRLQEQAQFAVNRIGGIVQIATEADYDATSKSLTLINDKTSYRISLDEVNQELLYGEYTRTVDAFGNSTDITVCENQVLATDILDFGANTDHFADAKVVHINLTIQSGTDSYVLEYSMTARNDAQIEITSSITPVVSILCDSTVIMVPGETLDIPVTVRGSSQGFEAIQAETVTETIGNTSKSAHLEVTNGTTQITVKLHTDTAKEEDEAEYKINVSTKQKDESGNPLNTKQITIQVRRIKELMVEHTFDKTTGTYGARDSQYTFSASVKDATVYLNKSSGATWDYDYKNPRAVEWSYEFYLNGALSDQFASYYEIVENYDGLDVASKGEKPYITFRLRQDMPSGSKLVVTATSKHAGGTNKAGVYYQTIIAKDSLSPELVETNADIVKYMEPYENQLINLSTTLDYQIYKIEGQTDTSTQIKIENKKLRVAIGGDEKGSEIDGNYGLIRVTLKGVTNSKYTKKVVIAIRRVNTLRLEWQHFRNDGKPDRTQSMFIKGADIQFKTRFNTPKISTNLYQTSGEEGYYNAFSVRFEWEYSEVVNGVRKVLGTGTYDWMTYLDETKYTGGSGTLPENQFSYLNKDTKVPFKIVDFGANSQQPCMNISLTEDFPVSAELTVKATSLHSLGKVGDIFTNRAGRNYYDSVGNTGISATITLKGTGIEAAADTMIVEPNQGNDNFCYNYFYNGYSMQEYRDQNMYLCPVYFHGTAGMAQNLTFDITIKDSTDSTTHVVTYTDGNKNPTMRKIDDSNYQYLLALKIGQNETGKSGIMKLHIKAYGNPEKKEEDKVGEITVKLALRRVTQVELVTTKEDNRDGGTIVLTAAVKGYGKEGTQYFAKQVNKDSGTYEYIWEKDYIDPYGIDWYMSINGVSWTKIGQNFTSDYVKEVTINNKDNATRRELKVSLNRKLPTGAMIKAVAVHPKGRDETDYNKYTNKSKTFYDQVFTVYLTGSNRYDPDDEGFDDLVPVMRGQDYLMFNDPFLLKIADNLRNATQNKSVNRHFYYRIRKQTGVDADGNYIYGDWSIYYQARDSSEYQFKFTADETRIFLPNVRYQVEVASLAIDKNNNRLIWPCDASILTSEYGLENLKPGWTEGTPATSKETYSHVYIIGRAQIYFTGCSTTLKQVSDGKAFYISSEGVRSIGTADNPIVLHAGMNVEFYTESNGGIHLSHYQDCLSPRLQMQTDMGWVTVDDVSWLKVAGTDGKVIYLTNVPKLSGKVYRISVVCKKNASGKEPNWSALSGTTWNPQYTAVSGVEGILCGNQGTSGYIYFTVQ